MPGPQAAIEELALLVAGFRRGSRENSRLYPAQGEGVTQTQPLVFLWGFEPWAECHRGPEGRSTGAQKVGAQEPQEMPQSTLLSAQENPPGLPPSCFGLGLIILKPQQPLKP